MLTPEYLEQVGSDLSDLYYDFETEIIADIAERLKINGDRMTTTAEYLVMKLEQMGYQHEYIQRRLASIMNISEQKVSQILDDSTYQSMRDSLQRAKTYESVDGSSISFDEQILQSKTAINAELKNLTNSTARMATNTMLRTFDDAYMKVSSGAYSLNQAVDQAIKELIDTGIGQVTYRSGTKRNIDTAVRVAVRTGVNQNALKCDEQLLEATEHNLVVVSAHMGARPSHAEWQGKIYWRDHPEGDYENFEEATGYGTGAGLGGWNCRHQFFAYYPEMGNPYEDVDTNGNQEVYELTQQQRYNERMIRKWKRRKAVYEKAGLDTTLENQKIREWTERNNALIKSSKYLKRQYANEKGYAVMPIEMYRRKGHTHRKTAHNGGKIIDKALYNRITKPAIKAGADIRIADDKWQKHLENQQASAVSIGNIIFFSKEATVSDVLEEIHHFYQNKKGMNDHLGVKERAILNEIDAKEYLLSSAKKYKIPLEEVELTKKQLESYKKEKEKLKKEGKWHENS